MQEFLQQLVFGLSIGSVYGSLALALVLIHRATGIVNFAQGEMAMFTTFIAWSLITTTASRSGPRSSLTLAIAFVVGVGVERVVIRPFYRASPLTIILVTIALFVIFNGLAAWIWSPETRYFPSPFSAKPFEIGGVAIARQDVGVIVVTLMTRRSAVGVLPLHAGRPRDARRRDRPGREPAARRPRRLDVRAAAGASRPSSARSPG